MEPGNIAIIGGTGFEELPPEVFAERIDVLTPEGPAKVLSVSDNYTEPYKLYFLSRHGADHSLAPHEINYRANILALQQLNVRHVFATNAVGSLRAEIAAGSYVVLDDFIDFTRHRPTSLFAAGRWSHTDFTRPYCPVLREMLVRAAAAVEIPVQSCGTYVCCDGPRFETPAEVRLFASWGGDVVGMTGLPEAVFAREAQIGYAALVIVTNLGAGLSSVPIAHEDVISNMATAMPAVRTACMTAARLLVESWTT